MKVLTVHEAAYPRIADPDHRGEDNAGEIWTGGDAVGII